jgi:SAM-dependent methyltransferase
MSSQETFQIPLAAAEAYEAHFVPSIFEAWASHALRAADVRRGSTLLDVACGTGIVARTGADLGATTVGLDANDAMLTVARRVRPDLEWQQGDAHALPFDDDSFDAATCQMALMFMADRRRVIAEMCRVVRPGGRAAIVVPANLDRQPAYRPFVEIAVEEAGTEARSLLATYWSCGDIEALTADVDAAGAAVVERRTCTCPARFASSDAFVDTEIDGSPLAERIDDETRHAIHSGVAGRLASYRSDAGFDVPLVGHVVAAAPI